MLPLSMTFFIVKFIGFFFNFRLFCLRDNFSFLLVRLFELGVKKLFDQANQRYPCVWACVVVQKHCIFFLEHRT